MSLVQSCIEPKHLEPDQGAGPFFYSDHMSDSTLPPPPTTSKRNPWKIAAIVLGVLIAVFVLLAIIGTFAGGDNRDEKLAKLLPASIESNFKQSGVDVTVTSVDCEKLPTTDGEFTISCGVMVEGVDEVLDAKVVGSVTGDFIQVTDVSSEERLLTADLAMTYVQGLVASKVDGVEVLTCDLGVDILVIRPGSEIRCNLDSKETVTVTVQDDGSGEITDVQRTPGT